MGICREETGMMSAGKIATMGALPVAIEAMSPKMKNPTAYCLIFPLFTRNEKSDNSMVFIAIPSA